MNVSRLGLTFWGRLDHVGLMPYFLKTIELSPPGHGEATIRQGHTGQPGVIEDMLVSAGFAPRERGTVTVMNEWPDAGLAARALAAAGPSVPAIQAAGFGPFCEALREVIEPLHTPGAGIRIASEFGWITAELRPVDSLPQRFRRTGSPRSVPHATRPRPARSTPEMCSSTSARALFAEPADRVGSWRLYASAPPPGRRPAPGAVHPVRKQRRGPVTFASTFCARGWL